MNNQKLTVLELSKQLEVTRGSLHIARNHTTITNALPSSYNVGFHTAGCIQLLLIFFPSIEQRVVRHTAFHDYPEFVTGDVVGSAKKTYPDLDDILCVIENEIENEYKVFGEDCVLTELEYIVFELIDRSELLLWCYEQLELGCRSPRFLRMVERVSNAVKKFTDQIKSHDTRQADEYTKMIVEGSSNLFAALSARNPMSSNYVRDRI